MVFNCRCVLHSPYEDLLFLCSCESVKKLYFYAIKWRQTTQKCSQNCQTHITLADKTDKCESVSRLAGKDDWQTARQIHKQTDNWQTDKQPNLAFNAKQKRSRNINYNSEVLEVADRPDSQLLPHTYIRLHMWIGFFRFPSKLINKLAHKSQKLNDAANCRCLATICHNSSSSRLRRSSRNRN